MELSKDNQLWLQWVNSKSPKAHNLITHLWIVISVNTIKVVLYNGYGEHSTVLAKGYSKHSLDEAIGKCRIQFAENNLIKAVF